MKKLKIILLLLFISVGAVQNTQAQFFKKLEERAKEKIKQEAERRAQRRVDRKIDKGFDKTEEKMDRVGKPRHPKNKESKINTKYSFDWKMSMKMESKKGEITMHYLLKQDAPYFATTMDIPEKKGAQDMITIMDLDRNIIITLMNMQGNKIKQEMDFPEDNEDNDAQDVTIVETDTKTILGYLCQGYKVDTEEGTVLMYVAMNAPVSFNKSLSGNTKFTPKGFNPNILKKLKNGLMLEMHFISKKKKKYNMKMTCTSLKKNRRTVNTKGYKSFGF